MNSRHDKQTLDASAMDALADALAPSVHAALDREPPAGIRSAIRAAAYQRLAHRGRVIAWFWRSAVSAAAAGAIAVGFWTIQQRQISRRMQLLDHLLVLAAPAEADLAEQDDGAESLARRLLLLQGFDAETMETEPAEPPEPPATDAQWRNRRALPMRICG